MKQKHDPIGPSSLARAIRCPGSLNWARNTELQCGSVDESEDAEAGTFNHERISRFLSGWDPHNPDSLMTLALESGDEDLATVAGWLEGVVTTKRNAGWELGGCFVEVHIQGLQQGGIGGDWFSERHGTPDLVLWFRKGVEVIRHRAVVIDWKTGYLGPHDDDVTFQLGAYCALVMSGQANTDDLSCEGLVYHVPTGQSRHLPSPNTPELMRVWESVAKRMEDKDLTATRAGRQCRYCPAVGVCPATQATFAEFVEFGDFDGDAKQLKAAVIERIETFPAGEKLGDAIDSLPVMEAATKAVRARARKMEETLPGSSGAYSVRETGGRRECRDPASLIVKLRAEGMTSDDIWKHVTVSVPALEKAYVAMKVDPEERISKKDAREMFSVLAGKAIEKTTIQKMERRDV
ncbi:MAG: PD-(D/E)XK nuclease family protein [Nannocystaceae bacterium]